MSASDDGVPTERGETVVPAGRDVLGQLCFGLHLAVLFYAVIGWLAPDHLALIFYLAFLPAIAAQWWFNENSCVLNNLESLIRAGVWRSPANPEEGAWLLMLARDVAGLQIKPAQMDAFIYAVLVLLWGLGLWHLSGWALRG